MKHSSGSVVRSKSPDTIFASTVVAAYERVLLLESKAPVQHEGVATVRDGAVPQPRVLGGLELAVGGRDRGAELAAAPERVDVVAVGHVMPLRRRRGAGGDRGPGNSEVYRSAGYAAQQNVSKTLSIVNPQPAGTRRPAGGLWITRVSDVERGDS